MLLKISELLPKESSGILACCSPIPPLVRQCLHEIHHIVKKAREQAFENVSYILFHYNTIDTSNTIRSYIVFSFINVELKDRC